MTVMTVSVLWLLDGQGRAITAGDQRRQLQLLLRLAQGLPGHHHHVLGTLAVHHQAGGHQHDR